MKLKEQVYQECVEILNNKITQLQQVQSDLKESASNETKSTAGDKHETALAMLQIEQENVNKQLENLLLQKLSLQKITPVAPPKQIASGTLVKTNKGYFYLSIPLGKITVQGTVIICLSPQSPLGSKLMGSNINESVTVNGTAYAIEDIA